MKTKLILLIFVLLIFSGITALADTYGTYGDLTYRISNDEVTITACDTSASGELVIPAEIDNYPVTSIGTEAFYGCESLTSIIIPDSVTSIGYYAFCDCTGLTSISISDSVTSIGKDAFWNTSYYNNVNNWSDDVLYIGNHLIKANTSLSGKYSIKSNTKTIAAYAFDSCSNNLTDITIPNSVTSIGDGAFYGCTGLTSITIPDGVTYIGGAAFYGCTHLTSITIPDSVTYIGGRAFYYCQGLTKISLSDSITSIYYDTFYGCMSLTSIIIPDGVTSISKRAFYGCESLTSIIIPDSVTSIGSQAFYYCESLTSITIPDSVISIGDETFDFCPNLKTIYKPISATWEYDFEYNEEIITVCKISYKLNDEIIDTRYVELNKNAKHLTPPDGYTYIYTVNGEKWDGIAEDNADVTVYLHKLNPTVNLVPETVKEIDNKYIYAINVEADTEIMGKFIICLYDRSERIAAYAIHGITDKAEYLAEGEIEASVNAVTYKAFLWEDFLTLAPISPVIDGTIE